MEQEQPWEGQVPYTHSKFSLYESNGQALSRELCGLASARFSGEPDANALKFEVFLWRRPLYLALQRMSTRSYIYFKHLLNKCVQLESGSGGEKPLPLPLWQ